MNRKRTCFLLVASLLLFSSPRVDFSSTLEAAADTFAEAYRPIHKVVNGVETLFRRVPRQRTLPERFASISAIEINPSKLVAYVGDNEPFRAIGKDSDGVIVQGLKFAWSTPDSEKVRIDETGRATFLKPGLARITCGAGDSSATATVLIRSGKRAVERDPAWRIDQGDPRAGSSLLGMRGTSFSSDSLFSRISTQFSSALSFLSPTADAQGGGSASTNSPFVIGAPRNGVIEATRFGSVLPETYDYELSIPVVASLGNRGLNIPLTLYYNSRIWGMTGPTTMQFDPNQSWPCPGFSMGFGRIDTVILPDGVTAQYTLVDPNGTTHYLGSGPAVVTGAPPAYPTYNTNDGTYISYVGDAVHGGELYYPTGAKYDINLQNNRLLPTQITDTNGNYVQIAYRHTSYDQNGNPVGAVYSPFAIDYVVDTLGRNITFTYDTGGSTALLTSVAGPTGGASFSYQQKQLTYNFYSTLFGEPMTVQGAPSTYFALTTINAQQQYQLSYSDYGMVYSFTMGRSNTVTVTFDYPISGTTQLAGAPAFTQRTETSGTASGTYAYSVSNNVSTITRPDASVLTLTDNGSGLLSQAETKLGTKSYSKTTYTYANDPGGAPQVVTAISYDDMGVPRRIDYAYDQFGNITNELEYGFQVNGAWQVQRQTVCSYQGAPYTTNHMLRLLTTQNLYDGANSQIAGVAYAYDGYGGLALESYSQGETAPGHLSSYDSTYTLRGNVTTQTLLTNVATGASVTKSAAYDEFGNVVQIQLNCCNQKSFTFNQDTYWSQPDQTTSGSAGLALSNNSSYDFDTSHLTSQTDPNGLTTNYGYGAWLNPTSIDPPGGAAFSMGYDDWGTMASMSVSYTDAGSGKSFSTATTKDGWGNVIQRFDPYGNQINLTYDSMGRLASRTNPFVKNGTPGPVTTYHYDTLGRVTLITLPNNQPISYQYSGSTLTVVDEVGREKQAQHDGLGRLTIVNEQDPATGQLTLTTSYSYDLLDDPTQIVQRGQTRSFKYDAIGEMLYQRMPEQGATISDGSGGVWSMKYAYNGFGSVSSTQDARGVVTTYGYDSLNRLTSVTYDTSNAPGVAPTNNVTYSYDTSTSSTTKGLLLSVGMSGPLPAYQETFSYDSLNRVSSRTLTRDGQTYRVSYQYNNLGQLTTLTYPSGRVLKINHDSQGRLSSETDPVSGAKYISNFSFSPAGQFTGDKLGNGATEAFGYDAQTLQLTSQTATAKGGPTGGLLNLNYSYQAAAGQLGVGAAAGNTGQLVSIANSSIGGHSETAAYTYDLLRRLVTSAQTSNGFTAQRRFSYDGWGNRTGEWDATSGGNQLQSIALQQSGGVTNNRIQTVSTPSGSVGYSYDAAGNVTSDGIHAYQYDAEDRLVSVDGGASGSYAYDFRNLRISKAISGGNTHYIWDGGEVIAEHNGVNGAQIVDYVFAGVRLIGEGSGSTFSSASAFTYELADRLSIRLSVDQTGAVTGLQGHLPFGEAFGESGTQEKHHFTSYERDAETGNDYAQNREYSSNVGAFLQIDPAASILISKYVYANDDPINQLDRDGLVAGDPAPDPNLPELLGPPDPSDGVKQTTGGTSYYDNGYLDFSAKRQGKIDKRVTKWLKHNGVTDPNQIGYYLNQVHNWPTDIGAAIDKEIDRAYAKFECGALNPITAAAAAVPRNGVAIHIEPTAMANPYYNPNDTNPNDPDSYQYFKGYYDPNTNDIYVAALIIRPGDYFYSAFLLDPVDQSGESGISFEFENYIAVKIGIPPMDLQGHPGSWPCDQHISH